MKGGAMPDRNDELYISSWHKFKSDLYDTHYHNWLSSLQPCEISESELDKISNYLKTLPCGFVSNPIDVTDIVKDNNGVITFKQPKQVEEIEAVEFAEWILDNTAGVIGTKQRNYYVKGLLHGKYTTKQLYEIFKNQK